MIFKFQECDIEVDGPLVARVREGAGSLEPIKDILRSAEIKKELTDDVNERIEDWADYNEK